MAKICFVTLVLNGDFVLEQCIKVLLPFGKVIVAEGAVDYFRRQGITTSTDRTNEILNSLLPTENIIHGTFPEKDDMMNSLNHLVPDDTTHVWMVDSDEIWRKESIQNIIDGLDMVDSVSVKPNTFFGGFDRTIEGFEQRFMWYRIQRWFPGAHWASHRPPTIISRWGVPWANCRHWNYHEDRFAHYSYVFPKSVRAKAEYYASRGGNISNWFERVWLPWVLGDDAKKQEIEDNFDGVHEWVPVARGDARTAPFTGHHPEEIQKILPQLKERFDRELAEIKIQLGYA